MTGSSNDHVPDRPRPARVGSSSLVAQIRTRWRALVDRRRVETDLDDELRFHLEMETDRNVERGMSREDAERAARLALGGLEGVKEAHRDQRGVRWIEDLGRDTRWAWRRFVRRPGSTLASVLTLGLGVGATVAVYGVIHGVLLEPLPFPHGERTVALHQPLERQDNPSIGFSVTEMQDLRARTRSFDAIVEYHSLWFNLFRDARPERVLTGVITPGFFREMGVEAAHGRLFLPTDAEHGADPVLVLSDDYFRARFGADPAVVGKTVEMNERTHTIVGILPPLTRFPRADDVYMPTLACPFRNGDGWLQNRAFRPLTLFAIRKEGVSAERMQAELADVAAAWRTEHPDLYPEDAGHGLRAVPLLEQLTTSARPVLAALVATVLLVCLLACANVANLGLAQGLRRLGELRMQRALGAGRGRILRQLIAESVLVGVAAGGIGLALAVATHGTLLHFVERLTPRASEIRLDLHLVGAALVLAILAATVAGGLPGLVLLRRAASAPAAAGRGTDDRERSRLRDGLVAVQVAMAVVLLAGAALFGRSFWNLRTIGPGYDVENVLTLRLDLDFRKYMEAEPRGALFRGVMEEVRALPGVVDAALVGTLPLDGSLMAAPIRLAGDERADVDLPRVEIRTASERWFETLRIPLLRGRTFTDADLPGRERVGVVSRSAAERLVGPDEDPVGRSVSFNGGQPIRIVGVVEDVRQASLASDPSPELYLSLTQTPPLAAGLAVRSARPPTAVLHEIEEIVRRRDPRQPLASVRSLEEIRENDLAPARVMSTLLATLAGLAFLITAVGIGAVVAFAVGRRTREIGIRRALGARDREVVGMLVREGMTPVAIGLVGGLALARVATPALDRFLFRIGGGDPLVHLGVAALLLLVAIVACLLPARRAAGIDPLRALRTE